VFVPNVWDAVAFVLVLGAMVLVVHGARETTVSLTALDTTPASLDPANLPEYALRTTLRMLTAIVRTFYWYAERKFRLAKEGVARGLCCCFPYTKNVSATQFRKYPREN
jgi:hypothetical protein